MMHSFDLAALPPMPWKNGGGATREIACWPPGAAMDGFDWRCSVATIDRDGPFSAFPGIDRQILLLDGDGVLLQAPGIRHRLDRPDTPWAFAGEAALDCRLLGGPSTDFNTMVRRGRWQASVQLRDQALPLGQEAAGLCLVRAGCWRWHGGELLAGQGLWWSESQAAAGLLAPAAAGARLLWVRLQPG